MAESFSTTRRCARRDKQYPFIEYVAATAIAASSPQCEAEPEVTTDLCNVLNRMQKKLLVRNQPIPNPNSLFVCPPFNNSALYSNTKHPSTITMHRQSSTDEKTRRYQQQHTMDVVPLKKDIPGRR
jgi:hypothetical protein